MKAKITFFIGLAVAVLGAVQFAFSLDPVRLVSVAVGLFFLVFGWKIGWTAHRRFTILLGHLGLTIGCLVTAYSLYQMPFLPKAPTLVEVLDLPLFWGLFTVCGGYCMITHGHCSCAIQMHDKANGKTPSCPKLQS